MANIADNLKRLLGTEGNNIQEVLENADSIGGAGSIPYIQFVETEDPEDPESKIFVVGEIRGITDVTKYIGPCYVNIIAPTMMMPAPGITMLGSAHSYSVTALQVSEDEVEYASIYSIMVATSSSVGVTTFTVYKNDPIDFSTFALDGSSSVPGSLNPGTLTPVTPGDISDGGTA